MPRRLSFQKVRPMPGSIPDPDSKPSWKIINRKKQLIGIIFWNKPWKTHVFQSDDGCMYSSGCLQEIMDFMKGLGGEP